MAKSVAVEAGKGRLAALESLAETLVEAIGEVDDEQVPALAARLVDVLRRIGGRDPSVLLWLRDGLAVAVDRLAAVQGQTSEKGRPLGTELAPMVRQLVEVIEALDGLPVDAGVRADGVVTIEDAKARRAARQQSAAQAVAGAGARRRNGG